MSWIHRIKIVHGFIKRELKYVVLPGQGVCVSVCVMGVVFTVDPPGVLFLSPCLYSDALIFRTIILTLKNRLNIVFALVK